MKRKEKKNPIVSWVRFPTTKYKRKKQYLELVALL